MVFNFEYVMPECFPTLGCSLVISIDGSILYGADRIKILMIIRSRLRQQNQERLGAKAIAGVRFMGVTPGVRRGLAVLAVLTILQIYIGNERWF